MKRNVLDKGFVSLVDHMGSDISVVDRQGFLLENELKSYALVMNDLSNICGNTITVRPFAMQPFSSISKHPSLFFANG